MELSPLWSQAHYIQAQSTTTYILCFTAWDKNYGFFPFFFFVLVSKIWNLSQSQIVILKIIWKWKEQWPDFNL